MLKTFIIIALSALIILVFLYIFVRSPNKALDVAQIEDIEKEIIEINKIVSEKILYLEMSNTEKNPEQLETYKSNIKRLTNDYILRKKLIEKKINYLHQNGIDYNFSKILPIND
jgi:hypothetical protein